MVPAQAMVEQFKKAQEAIAADNRLLASYIPMLSQYGPDLLVQCENASQRSVERVGTWLTDRMFVEMSRRRVMLQSGWQIIRRTKPMEDFWIAPFWRAKIFA